MKTIRSDEQLIDTVPDRAERRLGERLRDVGQAARTDGARGLPARPPSRARTPKTPFRQPSSCWRKAGTIHNREILGCWLHEVAYRTAIRARERRVRSTPRMEIQEVEESHSGPEHAASRNELRLLLRAEVDGLPAKYRSLVLHTYMEGKSNEQVARLLRCPVGTVKGRLSRARDLLRARLSRRGWDEDEVRYRWG